MFHNAVGAITSLAGEVLNRVLPPGKISEKDRLEIEAKFQDQLLKSDWRKLKATMADMSDARQLAGKDTEKGNAFTTALAAIHRPIWSFACLGVFVWTLVGEQFGLPKIVMTEMHKDIITNLIIFYFGGRSIEKVLKKQ